MGKSTDTEGAQQSSTHARDSSTVHNALAIGEYEGEKGESVESLEIGKTLEQMTLQAFAKE